MKERSEAATAHLAKVNGWERSTAEEYVEQCFEIWQQRSRHKWQLDLSELDLDAE